MARFQLPHLGPRARKITRIVGFVLLFFVTFVFALQWTFPFDRVKDKVVEVLSAKYETEISGIERGLIPGRVYFKAVTLRTRPTKADEVPTTFYIERLQVDVGLLALLGSKASVDIDAKIGSGHITGNIAISKGETSIHIEGENLPAAMLPMKEAIGLPMSAGKLAFSFNLDLPNEKQKNGRTGPNWQKAVGGATINCSSGCTIGDGKTKLTPKLKNSRNQAFAEGGIEFGKINITTLAAKVDIAKGHLKVTKFETKSEDGDLHVDLDMTLARAIDDSTVTGCLRFTGSPTLMKRDARTHAAISTTGAPLGPDNLYHIKLDGSIKSMKRLGVICGQGAASEPPEGKTVSRETPNLSVQPEQPQPPPPPPPSSQPPPQPVNEFGPPADAGVNVPVPGQGSAPGTEHNLGSAAGAGVGSSGAMPTPAPPPGDVPPAMGSGSGSAFPSDQVTR